jgi:hypothetical protein
MRGLLVQVGVIQRPSQQLARFARVADEHGRIIGAAWTHLRANRAAGHPFAVCTTSATEKPRRG